MTSQVTSASCRCSKEFEQSENLMSGQAGIYYYDHRPIDRSLGDRLGAGLSRQGPDGGSEHFRAGLLMVYRAFHIEPESYIERQPYVSPRGNWMTWDGRLDNRENLLLLVKDHLQGDTTDVALAMAAYEKWGESGFNRLIGDWSLALWEASSDSIVLASDYMGTRPLYYYTNGKCVAWSSDLGLLVSWFGVEDDLDNHYIAAFVTGSARYDRTIYRSISFVPCAHSLRAKAGQHSQTPFWYPPVDSRIRSRDKRDYEEQLLHFFREAVLQRLRTNDGVCCDLSGGLDSSSVTCLAYDLIESGATSQKPLVTFSALDPDMDDERYIRIVEQYCGSEGIYAPYGQFWSLDAPSSPMPVHSNVLSRAPGEALQNRNVRSHLTGIGGDLAMGNILEDTDQLADALHHGDWVRLLREAYAWSRTLRIPIWLTLKLAIIPLLSASQQQEMWEKKDSVLGQAYGDVKKIALPNKQFIDRYLDRGISPYSLCYREAIPSQRSFFYGVSKYQTAHSLSVRLQQLEPVKSTHPFCHRPLVEFVAAIPRQQLCGIGRPRDLMRRAFAGILPPEVLGRRTKALAGPASDKSLLEILPALCSSKLETESRGYINGTTFRRVLQNPQAANYDRGQLTQALILEVWLRTRRSPRLSYLEEAKVGML
jgi:asparagine synthase (glutamine-hydrolysing)